MVKNYNFFWDFFWGNLGLIQEEASSSISPKHENLISLSTTRGGLWEGLKPNLLRSGQKGFHWGGTTKFNFHTFFIFFFFGEIYIFWEGKDEVQIYSSTMKCQTIYG